MYYVQVNSDINNHFTIQTFKFPETFYQEKKVLIQHWGNFLKNHSEVLYENYCHLSMKEYLIRSYIFFEPLSTNRNPFEKGNSQFNGYAYKKNVPQENKAKMGFI